MSIGLAECPRFESPAGSCWAADGTRACEHACDCMCHWDFDRLRQTIGGLRMIARWALLARRALSDVVTREPGSQRGVPTSSTSPSQLSASAAAPAFWSSERDP